MEPEKSPLLLSTNTELIISPKSRKKLPDSAQVAVTRESPVMIARLLPTSETRVEMAQFENPSSTALVSPHTLRALSLREGQRVYLQRILPPIQSSLKDIKHLQQSLGEPSPKDMALKKLRDEISAKDRPNREVAKEEEPPSFALKSLDTIPANHIALFEFPESRAWDIIR